MEIKDILSKKRKVGWPKGPQAKRKVVNKLSTNPHTVRSHKRREIINPINLKHNNLKRANTAA